jgi:hypothetical protein
MSTIILKKYATASNFSQEVFTYIYDTTNQSSLTIDSAHIELSRLENLVTDGWDWTVELPYANRLFRIKNISYEQRSDKNGSLGSGGKVCYNNLSYNINDSFVTLYGQSNASTTEDDYIILNK